MEILIWILFLVAVMWVFQLYMAVKQSQRFSNDLREIRLPGTTTTVGMGGYRYRGGRAFVAMAQKRRGGHWSEDFGGPHSLCKLETF